MVDLENTCTINAVQVNFADNDADAWGMQTESYKYKVEVSDDKNTWTTIIDRSDNTDNICHDYTALSQTVEARYVRVVNVECPFGKFSLSGLRVFGTENKDLPATTEFTTIIRSTDDARTVTLTWEAVPDAVGYNIRYGYAPDKMYLNYTVYGSTVLNISSLSANETYYFSIDPFNEAGVTKGTEITEVEPGIYKATDPNRGFFPLERGGVNPNIFSSGEYDADTHTLVTGLYGFGGWEYSGGADWSRYSTLTVELQEPQTCGASFHLFDEDSYWSDCASFDLGDETTLTIDLHDITKDNSGEALDPSHITIAGFWSFGGSGIKIKDVYLSGYEETGIQSPEATIPDTSGDGIWTLSGIKVGQGTKALEVLPKGIYIMGGKKVVK